jgi:hypothetical protein
MVEAMLGAGNTKVNKTLPIALSTDSSHAEHESKS